MPENKPPPDQSTPETEQKVVDSDLLLDAMNASIALVPPIDSLTFANAKDVSSITAPVSTLSQTQESSQAERVKLAEPFTMVSFHAALADARSVSVGVIQEWLAKPAEERRMLFDGCREECHEVAIVRDT